MADPHATEGIYGGAYGLSELIAERDALAADLAAALAREDGLREALRGARTHLRPEVGGRFDQRAAVAAIDAALASAGEPAKETT